MYLLLIFNAMFYDKNQKGRGRHEEKVRSNIKMWENVACSNVDYLLPWQWVSAGCRTLAISK